MNKFTLILILALIVGSGFIIYQSQRNQKTISQTSTTSNSSSQASPTLATLVDFSPESYAQAIKSEKLVVVYFYANWCPICRAEFPQMQQAFASVDSSKVIGVRVHYNDDQTSAKERDLASEFKIPYQHTKVFLKNGKEIFRSGDSWTKDEYKEAVKKYQ